MPNYGMRKCIICGAEFLPRSPNQLTCSTACSNENRNRLHAEWWSQHREEENAKRRVRAVRMARPKQAAEVVKAFKIDFDNYDEYAKRQKAESIEKYARIKL